MNFNATKCDYVVLRNNLYACDEVKRNYSSIVADVDKMVTTCDEACPTNSAATAGRYKFHFGVDVIYRLHFIAGFQSPDDMTILGHKTIAN